MKKRNALCVVSALSLAMVMSMAACGQQDEPVTFDREAKAFDAPNVTISLDGTLDKTSARYIISDTLFGVFLEDINYASYALDDNLLVNGSFEEANARRGGSALTAGNYGWTASDGATLSVKKNQSDGPMGTLYKDYNNNYVNGGYGTLTAGANGGKLVNSGYNDPSMAVKEGVSYVFSAFVRNNSSAPVSLTVSVKDASETYLTGTVAIAASNEWIKYQKTFTATKTGTTGLSCELSVAGACDLSLDGVKLETKDATIGIKNYMYNAIAELSPKFIRFPGGCVIEGVDEATAYDWKNSIGAVATTSEKTSDKVPAFEYKLNDEGAEKTVKTYGEQITRRANTDIWYDNYYEMEYGIGFYDYFVLCDALGASPVPVINCGLSDQGGLKNKGEIQSAHQLAGRHGNETDDYIQDALDLVCFANGSVTSADANEKYWAQVRSDMGHPEPFGLKYLGIGNEQFESIYFEQHYRKFVEAFAQAKEDNPVYDGIELIVGNGMSLGDCQDSTKLNSKGTAQTAAETYLNKPSAKIDTVSQYGIHDQHYYVNYMDLFTKTKMYDNYARPEDDGLGFYNVFVGEYSANSMKSFGDSYAANSTWANSWITALSEAAMMTAYERNGDIIKLAAYAPMFASLNGARQWNVDMMYFTNTDLVLSTNYYVQQLFMKHQGKYLIKNQSIAYADGFEGTYTLTPQSGSSSCAAAEIDKIYYVASVDAQGDIVLKIVNASGEDIDVNVALSNANLRGVAKVSTLQNDDIKAVNKASATAVQPEEYTVGAFGNTLGYTAKKYSVTAIVIDVK